MFFTDQKVINFETAKTSNLKMFGDYFRNMLEEGVYLAPSQYESLFISSAITDELADQIIEANYKSLSSIEYWDISLEYAYYSKLFQK